MKSVLQVLAVLAVGVLALVVVAKLLGFVTWVLSWTIGLAVVAAIGWVALKLLSAGGAPPVRVEEAKTEESKQLAAPEKKALSDAEAARLFEEARRKQQTETK